MKTLVIIPTYNERENIHRLVAALFALQRNLDVLIVDDGADGTDQVIMQLQAKYPNLFLIKRSEKGGRGTAVIAGLKFGLSRGYELLVEMDGDFSHDPAELPRLLEAAASDMVVIGSRYSKGARIEGWPWRRRIFSKLANIFAEAVLGLGIRDYTNGYRVYPSALVARMDFAATTSRGFIVLSEIAYELARLGVRFIEIPIRFVNRKRGASSFSTREIMDSLWSVLRIKFHPVELAGLAILAGSMFVGLTHGLPLTNVVSDESPNVGGVLRAMQRQTILPALGDVPYATVTYLLSYGFVAVYLLAALPFFGFDLAAFKLDLLDNLHHVYLVTRIASALLGVGAILVLHKLARSAGMAAAERLSVVALVMTNVIVAAVFRTTKIWVLSTVLVLWSIYYLYRALQTANLGSDSRARKAVFFSIFFGCLSFANFPLNFYAVGLPLAILYVRFRKERGFFPLVLKSLGLGALALAAVTVINWQNILDQIASILSSPAGQGINLTNIIKGLWPYLQRVFILFPLLVLPWVFARQVRDRRLFYISLAYFAVYLVLISITSPWVSEQNSIFRHLVPIGFFLGLLLVSLKFRFSGILPVAAAISVVYYVLTLVYLILPTTYNKAHDYAVREMSREQAVIVNEVSRLQFPLNAKSAAALQDRFCSTLCRETRARNLHADFEPLVYDVRRSRPEFAPARYVLFTSMPRAGATLIARFGSAPPGKHFNLDGRLGLYFDWQYFRLRALGETIYVYKFDQ